MDLTQLEYLIAIADEGAFSRAADRLGVTQPSLSQQIKRLEEELGAPLFDRLSRGVVPTQTGEKMIHHARRVLAEVAEAGRSVRDAGGKIAGPLAIGGIPTIAPFLLPKVLPGFITKYPGVELELIEDVTDRLVDLLVRGKIDVAILSTLHDNQAIHLQKIFVEPLRLMVARGHRLAHNAKKGAKAQPVAWSELQKERLLVLHEMHCLSAQVSQFCSGKGLHPPIVMRGSQLATLAATVSSGLGVSVVPQMMVDTDDRGNCVYLDFENDPPSREINLAWNLLRYRSGPSRAFVEAIESTFSPSAQRSSSAIA
jgi:LysR family hydrogen peroxide-inducible transcriptional activator